MTANALIGVKNEQSMDDLSMQIREVRLLSALSNIEISQLAKTARIVNYSFGDTIVSKKKNPYEIAILLSGIARQFRAEKGRNSSLGIVKSCDILLEESIFSSIATEEARASSDVTVAHVPKTIIAEILQANHRASEHISREVAVRSIGGFLSKIFSQLPPKENLLQERVLSSIGIKRFKAGQKILQSKNSDDQRLYIVKSGNVALLDANDHDLEILDSGCYFGEKSALTSQGQALNVIAKTDTVCLLLPREILMELLAENPELHNELLARIYTIDNRLASQESGNQQSVHSGSWFSIRSLKTKRLVRQFPFVPQAEEMDCAAACLTMICRHYGLSVPLGKIRELVDVNVDGASLGDLSRVAEKLGLVTQGVKCDYITLRGSTFPTIIHWEGYHFVVVITMTNDRVWVADPAVGIVELKRDKFEQGWAGICLFLNGEQIFKKIEKQSPWKRFFTYLRPHKKLLLLTLFATLAIQLLSLTPPLITQHVFDQVVVHQNLTLLTVLMAGYILVNVFSHLTSLLRGLLMNFVIRKMDLTMATTFYRHVLSQPVDFFAKRKTGDIFARFQENQKVRDFLTEASISTILSVLMIFIYVVVLSYYNIKLTFLLLAFVAPIFILILILTPKIKKYARETFNASTAAESNLMEVLAAAETVKSMGLEYSMRRVWEEKYANSLNVRYRASRFDIVLSFITQMLNSAAVIGVLWFGAALVVNQELTVGQLIAFTMIMGSVMSPLMSLVDIWDELQETSVAMERLGDVLDLTPEQHSNTITNQLLLPNFKGKIDFSNVSFRYNDHTRPVLKNLDFSISPGELIAVVGPSGSGKTTLAKLIMGFYAPSDGNIFVDDIDISRLEKSSLRKNIAYVMQSNVLFSGSINENIAIGDESPDYVRVERAAKLADAHEFIRQLPQGYEQEVGERGVGLSGGQLQRLCIARALYRNPTFLVFDEATSALDARSENNIILNMKNILKGRTSVIIAHRLSTIINADKILVLQAGSIVEQGNHQTLISKKGMYFELVNNQMAA